MPKYHVTLSGEDEMVAVARAAVRVLLAGCPCVAEAELIASEAATNSIQHSLSGGIGGFFQVTIDVKPGFVRLEITDDGPKHGLIYSPDDDKLAEYGRGLLIVDHLTSGQWGHDRGKGYATLWAELEYTVPLAIEGQ